MSILTDLRKAANHPLLLRSLFTDSKLKEMAELLVQVDEGGGNDGGWTGSRLSVASTIKVA